MNPTLLALALILTGCATTYQCERQAMQEPYGTDVAENILIYDDAMRACFGEPKGAPHAQE